MQLSEEFTGEIMPPTPIRVETGISRYPIHRLAKRGDIAIDIREKNEGGETSIRWEVTHSPGPLAYKIDTLVVNRRIENATRPIPKIIKLGSLRDICRELGHSEGENVNSVRNALRQNAFAGITAKIRYKQSNKTERTLKADFTRYSVVFTGEELPDGRKADAVYIILNDIYMQVINGAVTRPLDYDYLKILPPAAQRFYELLSYRMYAAIKNDLPRAKLVYSELCKYAPLTRQADWKVVRPQLARIHRPHKKHGYVTKIEFQDTIDDEGKPDWIICYQPGPKARAEYKAFTKRGGPVILETEPMALDPLPLLDVPEPPPQQAELVGHGITPTVAADLIREFGVDRAAKQIEHLEYEIEKKRGKIADPAAWLVAAIRKDSTPPKAFVPRAERQRQEEANREKKREAAEDRRREHEKITRERAEWDAINAFRKALTPEQLKQLQIDAVTQTSEETRTYFESVTDSVSRKLLLAPIVETHIRRILREQGTLPVD